MLDQTHLASDGLFSSDVSTLIKTKVQRLLYLGTQQQKLCCGQFQRQLHIEQAKWRLRLSVEWAVERILFVSTCPSAYLFFQREGNNTAQGLSFRTIFN